MLFNSLSFLLFFPIVTLLYWVSPHKWRNIILLVASYYFYMNWKPAYAILILLSTLTTWFCSIKIHDEPSHKKRWLVGCLVVNFSILFVFKYLNFFTESTFSLLNMLGARMYVPQFDILLPVGISFYTFQAVGYTIDVYRDTIDPERNIFTYALFVSFFPQLVAGPIERARNLLPQFKKEHVFKGDYVIDGIKLMVWGYFMKLCVADNVSSYVDAVYNNLPNHTGTSIWLATFFFTFQIFCDFGGYSLIAIGTARCLGFKLMQNFNHPYLSTSIRDFWHRWHISLSTWFGEYVYIPLGGSRCSETKHQRNLLLTMLISGVWHGANWTFICWGGLHGLLLCLNSMKNKIFHFRLNKFLIARLCSILLTFFVVMMCWVFFRSNTLGDAVMAFKKMFTDFGQLFNGEGKPALLLSFVLILLLMLKEVKDEFGFGRIRFMHSSNKLVSVVSTAGIIVLILLCGSFNGGQFIYFQF
ncbi:MAG: MBOAT family protein [Muribaculaceae bacterium]|nr:MBOAT family protein [Muribaculaceae bacterium]